jgi:DNA-binding response OmpR family regulator
VLLDLWMPGLNGFQVLNVLKQHPATHAIPVIALNDSDIASSAIVRVLSLGAIDIITKPPDLEALEAAVAARLDALDALAQPTNIDHNEGG